MGNEKELLCFSANDVTYAVEMEAVVEIYSSISVWQIPCLPDVFRGIYNYKGEFISILSLEKDRREESDGPGETGRQIVILVNSGEYLFGIQTESELWMCKVKEEDAAEVSEVRQEDCWCEKQIYKVDLEIVHLLDLKLSAREVAKLV